MSRRDPQFLHFDDMEAASEAAAREIARTLIEAVEARSTAAFVLAGGSTPRSIYRRLSDPELSPPVPWPLVHLFWGDERCVPLGMGADGHTASLFPGDPLVDESERWVGSTDGSKASPPVPRVSLTLPVLNAGRKVVFAVSGEAKRRIVRDIEERVEGSRRYPAARINAAGSTLWFVAAES